MREIYQIQLTTAFCDSTTVICLRLTYYKYIYVQFLLNPSFSSIKIKVIENVFLRKTEIRFFIGDGKCIPKDTDIVVNIGSLHRDSRLWNKPLEFIPERFSPAEIERRHPCSFIPFSYGTRNCIGLYFPFE